MAATPVPSIPSIKCDGNDLSDEHMRVLAGVRVELGLYEPGRAEVRFEDRNHDLLDDSVFKAGQALEVLLAAASDSYTKVFGGTIVSVGVDYNDRDIPILIIEARDASHRFATSTTYAGHVSSKISEIVTKIAQEHGLTPKVDTTSTSLYWLQAASDLHVLGRLCAETGFEWFVRGDELHVRDRTADAGPTLTYGENLFRFKARFDSWELPGSVSVSSWSSEQQKVIEEKDTALADADTVRLRSDAKLVTEEFERAVDAHGGNLLVPTTSALDATEAKARAGFLAAELIDRCLHAEGEANGDPRIRPGCQVTVSKVGERTAGTYYVTRVVHEFGEREQLRTRFYSTGRPAGASTVDGTRPDGRDGFGEHGLVIGLVTNVDDPEELGRVKVKFGSLSDTVESDWIRVATPWAGKNRGVDFRPDVDDEVVIGFERGHLRFPVVLGALWSAKNTPPQNKEKASQLLRDRVITSRVGHRLTFSDGQGPEDRHVTVTLADGATTLRVAEDGITIEAAQGKPLVLQAGKTSVAITDAGDLEVKAAKITLTATQDVSIEGANLALKGKQKLAAEGGADLALKGGKVALEGSGPVTVKGAMVKIN